MTARGNRSALSGSTSTPVRAAGTSDAATVGVGVEIGVGLTAGVVVAVGVGGGVGDATTTGGGTVGVVEAHATTSKANARGAPISRVSRTPWP